MELFINIFHEMLYTSKVMNYYIFSFSKVLGIVTGVLLQDQELRGLEFQQLPYHRIFIMLFLELSAPESVLEAISSQILTAFWLVFLCFVILASYMYC